MVEVRTKVGRLIIDKEKIEERYTGVVGAINTVLHPILSRIFNLEKTIPIKDIEKITYKEGIPYITKPHLKIHYKGKVRIIVFKHVTQMFDYEGAKNEMNTALDYLRSIGIKVEKA